MKGKWLCWALVAALLTGCATQRINWNNRIGTYTLDQAILDFGPPDKEARLSDGRLVAEWISHYSTGTSYAWGTGFYGYPGGVQFVQTSGPGIYEDKLRLTFTTNNLLVGWSKN